MSDFEVSYHVETEEQFWDELQEIVSTKCPSHELIDNALRSWLYLVATCRDDYLKFEDDIAHCSQLLAESETYSENAEYVTTQIIYSMLQEDESGPLHVITNFLLLVGRADDQIFRRMVDAGCFQRLVELVSSRRDSDPRLHRLLLEVLYEMSRIERLRKEDLLQVDDGFVSYLFQLIEGVSDDVHDPYHYPVIRVLLVLNEQYMVASTLAAAEPSSPAVPLTNRVIKVLSMHGPLYRTFGENIILLLNRETETSLQLLILKLLYLLFTTRATYEYFYTNDLRVLLDVIIRNLLDLPNESEALRHTYLRVLYPLLAHTQLSNPPHYKRDEIIKVLHILGGHGMHFAPADETTLRLVDRVGKVKWLTEEEPGESEMAQKFLGISLTHAQTVSNISVGDVAAVMEKPGVKTPSRRATGLNGGDEGEASLGAGEPEAVPQDETLAESPIVSPVVEQQSQMQSKKKPLPVVPKHKHGILMKAPTTPAQGVNGHGPTQKRLPPKLPPPRRATKLKVTTTTTAAIAEEISSPAEPIPESASSGTSSGSTQVEIGLGFKE